MKLRRIPRAVPAGTQWMGPHGMVTVLRSTFFTVSHTGGTPIDRPVVPLVARLRDEAEHQAGVQRVNDVLARMEKAKAEHDAAMADAAPWRATTGDCL